MSTVSSARLVIVTVGVTAALATAISARADQSPEHVAMQVCEDQLRDRYEDDTTFHLVRRKRYADGVRLEVAARIDRDNSRFATCWVTREEVAQYSRHNNAAMIAASGVESPAR